MNDITGTGKPKKAKIAFNEKRFAAQGEYAESIFRSALCDIESSIQALEAAFEPDPENQKYVNDLGWSLFEAGRLVQAKHMLTRAVEMNPADELARENLRICTDVIAEDTQG